MRIRRIFNSALGLCSLSVLASLAHADPRIRVLNDYDVTESFTRLKKGEAHKPFEAALAVVGEGVLRVTLSPHKNTLSSDLWMRGTIRGARKEKNQKNNNSHGIRDLVPVTATVRASGNAQRMQILFSRPTHFNGRRYYSIELQSITSKSGALMLRASMKRAPHQLISSKGCSPQVVDDKTNTAHSISLTHTEGLRERLGQRRELELYSETDHQFTALNGSNTGAKLSAMVNAASLIYEQQFNLALSLKSTTINTNAALYPSSMLSSDVLLNRFIDLLVSGTPPQNDAYYLFTGKNLNESVIGLAVVSAICSDNLPPVGLVQHVHDAVNHVILAHELGHNLSARHSTSGIMGPSLSIAGPPTRFSIDSESVINSHLTNAGQCLATVVAPTPSPPASGGIGGGVESPTPTLTPNPIPSASSTPSNPGNRTGNSGGGLPFAPMPQLLGRSSGRGITGSIQFVEQLNEDCTVKVVLSRDTAKITTGRVIATLGAISLGGDFSIQFTARPIVGKNTSPFYLAAITSCPDTLDHASRRLRITPLAIRARKRVSLNQWIKTLEKGFVFDAS
jgi:Metallo-peptidase family M12